MKNIFYFTTAASLMASASAFAQTAPMVPAAPPAPSAVQAAPARVILISMETLIGTSNAGKAAFTDLNNRIKTLQADAQRQGNALKAEEDSLVKRRDVMDAAAFDAAVKAFQEKAIKTQNDLAKREADLQSIRQHIIVQINRAINPLIEEEMKLRGANVALELNSTLASSPSIDVTSAIMAKLNARLPSVSVTPLPQQAAPAPAPAAPPKK